MKRYLKILLIAAWNWGCWAFLLQIPFQVIILFSLFSRAPSFEDIDRDYRIILFFDICNFFYATLLCLFSQWESKLTLTLYGKCSLPSSFLRCFCSSKKALCKLLVSKSNSSVNSFFRRVIDACNPPLSLVAIKFHKVAYNDRLKENRYALKSEYRICRC